MDMLRAVATLLAAFSIDVAIAAIALATELDHVVALWIILVSNLTMVVVVIRKATMPGRWKVH
mgnify:CR=1 FL=1